MGISLTQWRFSIGTFNLISVHKKCANDNNKLFLYEHFNTILLSLAGAVPLKILFGLIKVFTYCFMIISLLAVLLILYPYLKLFCNNKSGFYILHCSFENYFVYVFCNISLLPYYISASISHTFSLYKSLSETFKFFLFFVIILQILLFISGSVELNPGPDISKKNNLSFAVWNLDSLPARDFARIPLIESLQNAYDFDMFGVCESMLTGNISNDDIHISGFSPGPFRPDKASTIRNGGVCLYFKESLPIKERCDLEIIPETIVAEIKLHRKKVFIVLSYRHPNMSNDEIAEYLSLLEKINESIHKENPSGSIFCGDFNARSLLFWEGDSENNEGRLFNNFLISNHLQQLISEPTHVRDDGSQSCIDLICADQPFLFTESGVLASLDSHSKHNIIHGTLNISIPRPPPFKRKIWDYKTAKTDLIRADLLKVNWHVLFSNLNVSEKSLLFTDVFLDIVAKHISSKIITCNERCSMDYS